MQRSYNTRNVPFAPQLRSAMPSAERKLWFDGLRHLPQHFRRQRPFGPYIADFYCAAAQLVIELDGESHVGVQAQARDECRDAYLKSLGLRVLRFTNEQVMDELEGVVAVIAEAVQPPTPSAASPPPPLRRRGGNAAVPPLLAGEVSPKVTEG